MSARLRIGDAAPDFTATDHAGRPFRLHDHRGRPVVLFFYPRDGTPVCTAQMCSFRDAHAELGGLGAVVAGVSPDSDESHRRAAAEHRLPFPLLSDASGALRRLFGVGRWLGVLPGRATFVIDPAGRIRHVDRAPWSGAGHGRRAVTAVRSIAADAAG